MFKKLLNKLGEDVRQSNLNAGSLGQFIGQDDTGGTSGGLPTAADVSHSPQGITVTEECSLVGDSLLGEQKDKDQQPQQQPQSSGPVSGPLPRQRTVSSSSQSSEPAVLPIQNSPDRPRYILQSDTESEAEGPVMVDLSRVTKEEIYAVVQRSKQKVERYKNKYNEAVRAYRNLNEEKDKIQKVLTDTQDKSLRRINELREQADLEQKAKAHLEENLRLIMDEKDEKIKVLRTKIDLLSNSDEVVKPFKEQVRQLNLDLQNKEADVIMAKELRSRAEKELRTVKATIEEKDKQIQKLQQLGVKKVITDETKILSIQDEELKKLKSLIQDKDKELQELRTKCVTLTEQSKSFRAGQLCNGEKIVDDRAKILTVENWEERMRASEKKLSQKENELRKIARKMHQLKLMVITEEVEEEENISSSDEGLAKKIEGSVDQLLNEKHQLQKTIDDLQRQCTKHEDQMQKLRNQLTELTESATEDRNKMASNLDEVTKEKENLRSRLEEELNKANLVAQERNESNRLAENLAKEKTLLEEKLKQTDKRSAELNARSEELLNEVSELQKKVSIAHAESEHKEKCVLNLEKQLEGLRQEKSSLEEQLNELRQQDSNNLVQHMIHLDSPNDGGATGDSMDDGTIKGSELIRKRLTESEERCMTLSEKLENFSALTESNIKEETNDMRKADSKLARLEETRAMLEAKVKGNSIAIGSTQAIVETLHSQAEGLGAPLFHKQTETARLSKQLQDLSNENECLCAASFTEHSESQKLRDQCNELQVKLEELESELQSTRAKATADIDQLSQDKASEVNELTKQIASLEAALTTEREQLAEVLRKHETIKCKSEEVRSQYAQAQARIAQMEMQLVEVRSEATKTSESKSILERELRAKLSRKEQEVEAATFRWDTAAKEKNSLETRLLEQENDFETERGRLNQEIRSLGAKVDQLEGQLKDTPEEALRSELASQVAELSEVRAKAQAAHEDVEQMRRAVEMKSQELIKVVDELASRERLQKEAEGRILKLEAQYAERVRTIEAKHLEVEELLRQTAKERDVFKENEDRLDKMYRQLEGQLRQVEHEGKLRIANVEALLIVEKDKLAKSEEARTRLESSKAKLEATLKNAKDRINTLEACQTQLEQQLAEKRLECESWQESLKTGDERNTKVRQELKEALATIQDLSKQIPASEERVREEYAARIELMESANYELQSRLNDIAKELESCQQDLGNTRSELITVKESPVQQENLQLRQSLRAAEDERERLARDAEKNREELDRATKRAELLGKEAKALRDCNGDEIDTLREQMDEYKNQSILAQERCDKLQREVDSLRKQLDDKDKDDGWNSHMGAWGNEEVEWSQADGVEVNVSAEGGSSGANPTHPPDEGAPAVLEVAVEESQTGPPKCIQPAENYDSVDFLRMQIAKQHDEIRDLKALLGLHSRGGLIKDMPGPTEYEYLKNIMFSFMMGKETQTLCKVIAAVLRFSREETRLVTERHESLHKVHALYGNHLTASSSHGSHITHHQAHGGSYHRPPH
ncbi:golgin subfamily A member 4-like isoform X1 [Varroa jacobsoni]|uniref:golgin subfamily A member 4-like isoform X1 n=1 Tax=Varroa jacobsoni TaxID=62625 RepID=UPI000BF5400D|nr:golgin subfamily A member 4-like isoform X1 [Varroa jacobsoni]XP_022705733.1 golgin subfamily A member 4-like isoform X1 [Varroa jacobsoni]